MQSLDLELCFWFDVFKNILSKLIECSYAWYWYYAQWNYRVEDEKKIKELCLNPRLCCI